MSTVASVQLGAALGLVSGRVLGQYEVFSDPAGQLLLVAPNILTAEAKLGVSPRDFRLWVCLHEVAHQTQFRAVPWLRDYFLRQLAELLAVNSPLELLTNTSRKRSLRNILALMTLMEGHAEYVMDAVGDEVLPTLTHLRTQLDVRRRAANPLQYVIRYVLGIEAKMRQYEQGKRFVAHVVEEVGMAGFNHVWRDESQLPDKSELADPAAWLARVRPTSVEPVG